MDVLREAPTFRDFTSVRSSTPITIGSVAMHECARSRAVIREIARLLVCREVAVVMVDQSLSLNEASGRVVEDPSLYDTFLKARWNTHRGEPPLPGTVAAWFRDLRVTPEQIVRHLRPSLKS